MDSFQPSRGRTFFEVLCALALAASLAGAWTQTGASALLAASGAAALFGLSHAFGMRRPRTVAAEEPQRIDFATDDLGDMRICEEAGVVPMVTELDPEPAVIVDQDIALDRAPLPAKAAKAPRKPRGGRKVAERKTVAESAAGEEPVHIHVAPLFEPEPFARHQHAVFGKRHTLR